MFTKAIVKKPCKNMIHGITTAGMGPPDFDLALEQHAQYIRVLESCGLSVVTMEADEAFPDSTFVEDTCLITPHCAILTNPGTDTRKGEVTAMASAVQTLGLPIERIQAPATLEAGDVMMTGSQSTGRHFYVGLSRRTNKLGFDQLESILNRYGMTASAVPVTSVLHLKTGVSYLENNHMLAWGEFLTKPELSGFTMLEVAGAQGPAANSVWINGTVLVPAGFEKTTQMIRSAGYQTIAVDISEFRKLDGGLSCLSLRF